MHIHNGDHAEFEIEHANTPPKERPDWPLPSFDARDWAEAFCNMHSGDVELMTTWFANALMRGYDERASRERKNLRTVVRGFMHKLVTFDEWRAACDAIFPKRS